MPDLDAGLYAVDDAGVPQQLAPGSYRVDEEGAVGPALNWQVALEKIQWEKAHEFLQNWGKRSSGERVVNLIGMYLLVAVIIAVAGLLAFEGIIEGQAMVGFLGAALGYLLARARTGGFGGSV